MTNTVTIAFDVIPTQASQPLAVSVLIDGNQVWHTDALAETQHLSFAVDDETAGDHTLCWVLSGKTDAHTVVDADGNIESDSMISVANVRMDEIDISTLLTKFCLYSHNFNGHGDAVDDEFFGHMGCNGTVTMKFTTPLYLWLLDNM